MQNDDINIRIALIIKELGFNKNSFSKAIGLNNNTTIGNIVSGRNTKPSFDIIYKIVSSFDSIDRDWLLTGKGSMLQDENKEDATTTPEKQLVCTNTQIKNCDNCQKLQSQLNECNFNLARSQKEVIRLKDELLELYRPNHATNQKMAG